MNLLYIDANIYLGLYNSNQPEFKKLLNSLIELRDNILLTEQIKNEVTRNKLNVFRQSIENYLGQIAFTPTVLPEHFDDEESAIFSEWNKERRGIDEQAKKSNKDILPLLDSAMTDVSKSSDGVSKKLEPLFAMAIAHDTETLDKARLRKETGNPPGKSDDPLGDQLSWEILLKELPKYSKLWIVSADRDYFTENKNRKALYLNPILHQDITTANSRITFKIFNKLSEALRDYASESEIKSLPSTDVLNKISAGEELGLKQSGAFGQDHLPSKPILCPKCQASNSFLDGAFLRSQFGGLTLQFICTNCKFHLDTGDYFD